MLAEARSENIHNLKVIWVLRLSFLVKTLFQWPVGKHIILLRYMFSNFRGGNWCEPFTNRSFYIVMWWLTRRFLFPVSLSLLFSSSLFTNHFLESSLSYSVDFFFEICGSNKNFGSEEQVNSTFRLCLFFYFLLDSSKLRQWPRKFLRVTVLWILFRCRRDAELMCCTIKPLPDDKIVDRSKSKRFADDILKCIENEK